MSNGLELEKHNRIRQLILRIIFPHYPHPVDVVLVRRTLADLAYPMDLKDLRFYLAFLEERGYVKLDDKPQYEILLVKITATGIDVLDGRITDCAIGCGGSDEQR